jgi:hypothetical protein
LPLIFSSDSITTKLTGPVLPGDTRRILPQNPPGSTGSG